MRRRLLTCNQPLSTLKDITDGECCVLGYRPGSEKYVPMDVLERDSAVSISHATLLGLGARVSTAALRFPSAGNNVAFLGRDKKSARLNPHC